MTPDQAKEQFSAAHDGELDAQEQATFDAALSADTALAREYAAFCDTLTTAKISLADAPVPRDLLPGVQRRLRARSRGRFYADRFAERAGRGLVNPMSLAIAMGLIAALTWLVFGYLQGVDLRH